MTKQMELWYESLPQEVYDELLHDCAEIINDKRGSSLNDGTVGILERSRTYTMELTAK